MKLTISQVKGHNRRLRSEREELHKTLAAIVLDCGWAEDWHREDPKALRYALQMTRNRAREALAKGEGRSTGEDATRAEGEGNDRGR